MLMRTLRSQVRWIMIAIVVLFVLSVFGMYGFDGARRGRPQAGEGGDYVVAEIDGKPVMRSALDQSVRNYVERMNVREIKPEDIPHIYQATLESLVINHRLALEAEQSGLKATDAELDAAVREVSEQFPTREAFMQYLDQTGVKMAAFRDNLATQIVQQKMVERASAGVAVTDEETLDFYEKTKALFFHSPAGYRMDYARLKNEAAAVGIVEAVEAGTEWKAVWESVVSDDIIERTPETGPVFVAESNFKEQLAVFADLEIGKIGGPALITSDDYFIGVKREKVEETTVPFDEVSGVVKALLTEEKRREAQSTFFRELRGKASVVIHDFDLFPKPEAPKTPSVEGASPDVTPESGETEKK